MEGEDQVAQGVVKEILPLLNITADEFALTHDEMANNPSQAEFVMAAQQGKPKKAFVYYSRRIEDLTTPLE